MERLVNIYKEKSLTTKGELKMKKSITTTERNVIYATFGAFLLGLGMDIGKYCIGMTGLTLLIVAMCLAFVELFRELSYK